MHAFPGVLQSGELARSAKEHVDLVLSIAGRAVAAVREIVVHHINDALKTLVPLESLDVS
jgi:DNA-binding GntR family transcriptional regulator